MYCAMHSWSFRDRFKNDLSFTIEQAIDLSAEMGFKGIEVMSGAAGSPRPGDFASAETAYLKGVVAHARRAGVPITCFSTYNDFAFTKNEKWRLENIEYVKEWTRKAGEVGVPQIRLLTGYWVEGEDRQKLCDLVEKGIAECLPVAEQYGVNLSLENHSSVFMPLDETLGLLRRLGSARLTACVDASNWSGAFFKLPPGDAVREQVLRDAGGYIRHATNAHLKVPGVRDEELVGWGADLKRLLTSYQSAGYRGPIAFESIAEGDLVAPLAEARKIVEATLREVVGTR
jgi:sugar phosphate isomerase/epimerase